MDVAFERPEYAELAAEFGRLCDAFGHAIDERLRRDIARLASAIERIDRRVDEAGTDDEERVARWADTVHVLNEVRRPRPGAPRELIQAAEDLRALGRERNVLGRIRRIVRDEAKTSESIRSASTMSAFIRAVEREGRLTAALALAIAGSACGPHFRRFFFRLAAPANLVDKILDARADHACGEIRLSPNPLFYVALVMRLCRRTTGLFLVRPWLVCRLARRYVFSN